MFDFFTFVKSSPGICYAIVFIGAMIEGETIILTASALAAAGYLSIMNVAALAFTSTLFADQLLFFIGHRMFLHPSAKLFERFNSFYEKSKRVAVLLKKYDVWFILMFRFIYGIRTISPIVIALCGSKPGRFVPLNFIAAVIWTVISCGIGYALGDFLFDSVNGGMIGSNVKKVEYAIFGVILFVVLLVCVSLWVIAKRNKKKSLIIDGTVDPEKQLYKATHQVDKPE
ncbi:MAG: DedA family protein [Holosporales bacterium]|jgi:membrane protein DedA with SNARE-associated domain|nr:DedA family protein [Holosporales bacterium]